MVFLLHCHQMSLAFTNNERGILSRAYFSDYQISVIEHMPWAWDPICIPYAIVDKVQKLLNEQILAGKYETAYSFYRSQI